MKLSTQTALQRSRQIILTAGIAAMLAGFASCKTKSQPANDHSHLPGTFAEMSLKENYYDFGTIRDGDTVRHTYYFTNAGKVPLIIENISASCGCTVLKWSGRPVAAHSRDSIIVQFAKRHDPGVHYKQIIVKANTKDPYTVLKFKAYIAG